MSNTMASRRRQSEIIKPLVVPNTDETIRRSNSWNFSDYASSDDEDDIPSVPLAEQLTNQRWHEVGNGHYPISASPDLDTMVDQLSSILAMRLRDLLIYWMRSNSNGSSRDLTSESTMMKMAMEHLRHDAQSGDYVLIDSIESSIREYVTGIGKLYNHVGFHSFEHATHVTISMNKLLSMVEMNKNFRSSQMKRLSDMTSERHVMSHDPHPHVEDHAMEDLSFGIGKDPRVLFAMVFSALIHDVGHTGVPNSVLVEEEDDLAILHNDVSVAEQNSLQVAFSMLQRAEFAELKRCICPTPEERKLFRKRVISMVMVTDISDQERVQIVKSRWTAAFPSKEEGGGGGGEEGVNGSTNGNSNGAEYRANSTETHRPAKKEIRSAELRASLTRRRFTMFSTGIAAEEFANQRSKRLGIRTSMDFSGMLLDAYRTTDQLQQHAVLETMMNAADVAHTMQSFQVFVKWNKRLFKEFYVAHLSNRLSFNPSENWYENQIGFFSHYIIPLSQKMKTCGVFGTTGNVFEYFAMENKKRWIEVGEDVSLEIIRDVKQEVEREQGLTNGCH